MPIQAIVTRSSAKAGWVAALLAAMVLPAVAAGAVGKPATASAPAEDRLAVESLLKSANELVVAPASTHARAARILALVQTARRLAETDPRTALMLTEIYQTQQRSPEAADALEIYRRSFSQDYAQAIRWLSLRLAAMESADDRLAFLDALSAKTDQPAALRAEAAAQRAQLLLGKALKDPSRLSCQQALKLDPYQPSALNTLMSLEETPTPVLRLTTALGLLKSNPGNVQGCWQLASLLCDYGLSDESLAFFETCWQIVQTRLSDDTAGAMQTFLTQYLSAALDAASVATDETRRQEILKQAEELGRKAVDMYPANRDLRSLLIETYGLSGQASRRAKEITTLDAQYRTELEKARGSSRAKVQTELAWFLLVVVATPQPTQALELAQRAQEEAQDPHSQRIIAAARLSAGDDQAKAAALAELEQLQDSDIYAAALVAAHYAGQNTEAFRGALKAGWRLARGGPGYRWLVKLARQAGEPLPVIPEAADMRAVMKEFDPAWLEMAKRPGDFVSVELKSPASVRAGEPVYVEAVLTNKNTKLPVPLGDWGLLSPVLALRVVTAIPQGSQLEFADLPMIRWPAPRYLAPGESVSCSARLDVGSLGQTLQGRPLEEFSLKVEGIVDPIERRQVAGAGGSVASAKRAPRQFLPNVPGLSVEPITITIESLMALAGDFDRSKTQEWQRAYQIVLGTIAQRDILRGDLPARVLAARRVGQLVTMADLVQRGEVHPPKLLSGTFARPVLLTMLRTVLKDTSATVRAEAVAGVTGIAMDDTLLSLLLPLAEDPNALVRLRLAEALVVRYTPAMARSLQILSADKDPWVRLVAQSPTAATQSQPTLPTTSRK